MLVAHFHAMRREALAHALIHAEMHVPVVRIFAPDAHKIFNAAALVLADGDERRGISVDAFVGTDRVHYRGLDVRRRRVVARLKAHINAAHRLLAVIDDGRGGHVAVRDADDGVVHRVHDGNLFVEYDFDG